MDTTLTPDLIQIQLANLSKQYEDAAKEWRGRRTRAGKVFHPPNADGRHRVFLIEVIHGYV